MKIGGHDGFPLILDLKGVEFSRIRITTQSVGTLQFDQCEVWTETQGQWHNVAAGVAATQSSIWHEKHGPETGNNGQITGDVGPHTLLEPNPWWELDFGELTACDYLVLFNRLQKFAERMKDVQIYGQGPAGGWRLLFNQTDADHVTRWGTAVLGLVDSRLAAQLNAAIPPQNGLHDVAAKDRAPDTVYGFQRLERIKALRGLLGSAQVVNQNEAIPQDERTPSPETDALKNAIRAGLHAALPMHLNPAPSDVFLFDVSNYVNVQLRASGSDNQPKAFTAQFFTHDSSGEPVEPPAPTEIFDYISCRLKPVTTFEVTNNGLSLSVDTDKLDGVRWELWGEDQDGKLGLLYDNTASTRAISQIHHVLEREDHPFSDLVLGARALEIEGKYQGAYLLGLYYPTDAPEDAALDDHFNQIEYRSFLDDSRKSVSRTKHGYRQTFLFKNKPLFTAGLQVVSDTLNQAGFTNVPFYGTLLGALRDATLIDHDDDGDLLMLNDSVSRDDLQNYFDDLHAWLKKNTTWTVYNGRHLPGNSLAVAFDHQGEWVHCDLFPTWVEDDDRMVLHETKGAFLPFPKAWFEPTRSVSFEGSDFTIPVESEQLLENIYGDWRTPYRGYLLRFVYQTREIRKARRIAARQARQAEEAEAVGDATN